MVLLPNLVSEVLFRADGSNSRRSYNMPRPEREVRLGFVDEAARFVYEACPAAAAFPVAWLFSSEKQSTQDNGQRAKFKSPITDVNGNSGTVSLGFTARIISQSLDE